MKKFILNELPRLAHNLPLGPFALSTALSGSVGCSQTGKPEQSKIWLTKWNRRRRGGASTKSPLGLGLLKRLRLQGAKLEPNIPEWVSWLRKAAEHNKADAQFTLGALLADARIVPLNLNEAFESFGKPARQNHRDAQMALSVI